MNNSIRPSNTNFKFDPEFIKIVLSNVKIHASHVGEERNVMDGIEFPYNCDINGHQRLRHKKIEMAVGLKGAL